MEGAPALPTGEGLVYSVETNSVSKGQVKLNVSPTYTGLKGKDLLTTKPRRVCSGSLEPASLPKHESSGPVKEALSRDMEPARA